MSLDDCKNIKVQQQLNKMEKHMKLLGSPYNVYLILHSVWNDVKTT